MFVLLFTLFEQPYLFSVYFVLNTLELKIHAFNLKITYRSFKHYTLLVLTSTSGAPKKWFVQLKGFVEKKILPKFEILRFAKISDFSVDLFTILDSNRFLKKCKFIKKCTFSSYFYFLSKNLPNNNFYTDNK